MRTLTALITIFMITGCSTSFYPFGMPQGANSITREEVAQALQQRDQVMQQVIAKLQAQETPAPKGPQKK